jgi:hypothetical protein
VDTLDDVDIDDDVDAELEVDTLKSKKIAISNIIHNCNEIRPLLKIQED